MHFTICNFIVGQFTTMWASKGWGAS
jgi:hypothetical protein